MDSSQYANARFAAAPQTGVQNALPDLVAWMEPLALTAESSKALGTVIYGVICFATMLSFIGTVLGGIWADQSWGRFWGWDPKENGALLIVIWNALILHARWAGLVKQRGTAVLTTSKSPSRITENFGVSTLPEEAVREISEGIKLQVRFNAVVETGVPGFIPRAKGG